MLPHFAGICGEIDGRPIEAYELVGGETRIRVMTYGAILAQVHRPDRAGTLADIVLGYDNPADYAHFRGSAGAVCGRFANRIAGAAFTLDGRRYDLPANDGANHLHGGPGGFGKRVWTARLAPESNAICMELVSEDGDEGYPGRIVASVTYALSSTGDLRVTMRAVADAPTIVNLAHHGYWNLAGHGSGSIGEQVLQIDADRYLPLTDEKIPTGVLADVTGTPFDFRQPKPIGRDISDASMAGGYDQNFCINGFDGRMRRCVRAVDRISGRAIELFSNQPGLQLYTANHFDAWPALGKAGARYGKYSGFALETQNFPNAPNEPSFPSADTRPGNDYHHDIMFKFSTE